MVAPSPAAAPKAATLFVVVASNGIAAPRSSAFTVNGAVVLEGWYAPALTTFNRGRSIYNSGDGLVVVRVCSPHQGTKSALILPRERWERLQALGREAAPRAGQMAR